MVGVSEGVPPGVSVIVCDEVNVKVGVAVAVKAKKVCVRSGVFVGRAVGTGILVGRGVWVGVGIKGPTRAGSTGDVMALRLHPKPIPTQSTTSPP